jgi:hypothetical protein
MWSQSSKSESRQSRKSRQRQKVCLNSREILIEIETSRFCLDINVQTKKSRSRSRNSSRSENFGVSRQFVSISIEKCVDFCIFLSRFLNLSRLFIIFRLKRPQQCQDFSTNLDCVLTNLVNPNASLQISTILTKISTSQSLNWKISILKISTEKKKSWSRPSRKSWQFKKVSLDPKDVLDLDWSRLSRPPRLYLT